MTTVPNHALRVHVKQWLGRQTDRALWSLCDSVPPGVRAKDVKWCAELLRRRVVSQSRNPEAPVDWRRALIGLSFALELHLRQRSPSSSLTAALTLVHYANDWATSQVFPMSEPRRIWYKKVVTNGRLLDLWKAETLFERLGRGLVDGSLPPAHGDQAVARTWLYILAEFGDNEALRGRSRDALRKGLGE